MSDKIKKLDTRAQSRDKIAVWFGSRENYHHPIKEVIANASDEIINNFKDGEITILLHDDNQTITISDSGRGIPLQEKTDGVSNYELLFETLFAGTKYDKTDSTTTGTNGVGTTVINHTSLIFDVVNVQKDKYHIIMCSDGNLNKKTQFNETKQLDFYHNLINKKHGTVITFKLDDEVYANTTFNYNELKNIANNFAIASNKVTYRIGKYYQDSGEVEIIDSIHYDSIEDYFIDNQNNKLTSEKTKSYHKYDEGDESTEIDLIFSSSTEPLQKTFLNLTYLAEGGSINDGMLDAIRLYANKYCRDNKLFPKGINNFQKQDIEDSISFVATILSNNVEFQNQTKLSTNKKLYKDIAKKHTTTMLESYEIQNEKEFKKFIDHLLTVQKHNGVYDKAKKNLKIVLTEKVDGINNRIENLVDCKNHNNDSELFICEGQSALGSIVLARDANYQAAYPLRGKILNCLKADIDTIFKNKIVVDLIKIIGCGIEADKKSKDLDMFDINNLRYGKIIATCDADEDGFQISCLIITMIYRLMPKLIEEGLVYIATTPLYEFKTKSDKVYYAFSENEKEKVANEIKEKYIVSRSKGLGELQAEVLAETAMDPNTRNIIKVTIDDAKEVAGTMDAWMGDDIISRKEFISENINKYADEVD